MPPTRKSTNGATPTSLSSWGTATTPAQPTARYVPATSSRGASIQASAKAIPSAAPVQTLARTTVWIVPESTSRAIGVVLAAMNR
jgi:hypothetical protein